MISFPAQYEANMKALLGPAEYEAYVRTFERHYLQGLRVNTAKISPAALLQRLGQDLKPVPWCPSGFYLDGSTADYSKLPEYAAGLFYLQEPSAMAPAAILPIEEGDKVLDLCAAPGGKSTQLAARLKGTGLLVANDISPSRARALLKNLELAGASGAVVTAEAPYRLSQRFPGYFNKILVDAPCSGEGMFHKEPAIMKNWEQYGNGYYAKMQREILPLAVDMLAPGGMFLYSTCTFSPSENEQIIEELLETHPELSLIPIHKVGGMADGLPEKSLSGREDLRFTARFWPHRAEGQGHFAALLQKAENAAIRPTASVTESKIVGAYNARDMELWQLWCEENLARPWREVLPANGFFAKAGEKLLYNALSAPELSGLRILRNGVLLGELKKDRFEPSQAFAMLLEKGDCLREVDMPADDLRCKSYLRGESLRGDYKDGWTLMLCGGYSLGWGKAVQGVVKNKYGKGWLQN